MPLDERASVLSLLLTRRGVAFVRSSGPGLPEASVRGVELELGELGYVLSSRLRARLAKCSLDELTAFRAWAIDTLLTQMGADRVHVPLFRRFPDGVPHDTVELWWKKVLVHFLQAEDQPCIFCGATGTTHVLNPCRHVVCDRCFDGTSYSACPSCEHHVDRGSPFFLESPERQLPSEKVVFKRLDLGEDPQAEARTLFVSLCERNQALSPVDRDAFLVILREYTGRVLEWLPKTIPLRENIAVIFGTLFQNCKAADVLPAARRHMTTATDVLRFIAVLSGTDGALLPEVKYQPLVLREGPGRFWGMIAKLLRQPEPVPRNRTIQVPIQIRRFKVAKLSRALRRTLLEVLDRLDPELLIEDLLRHRSYWVWVAEFLHPHEYATRFPNVARAFQVVRKYAPDGTPAPKPRTWSGRLEMAVAAKDAESMLSILGERPGELARRFDHALRVAGGDASAVDHVVAAFVRHVPVIATPVLLTLKGSLPTRLAKAGVRIYWPKGRVALGVSAPDVRTVLPRPAVNAALAAIHAELLKRFATRPSFDLAVVDEDLRAVMVPFNERTSSVSAVSLPRGSRIPVPPGKLLRLFLHWCQPEKGGEASDLDLSVAFYDSEWKYAGVCSYYQLTATGKGSCVLARSAGDLRDAPWPDGATEFVDLHRPEAMAEGIRYAVMVVNNYAGMPFSALERGFAGVMLRDDAGGKHFDPRTVDLKFALNGENGIFMPLVVDIRDGVIHWLDVHAKGQLEMNNVETSKSAIAKVCPELMAYFSSGVRPSMYDLALLHAAARCGRVLVKGRTNRHFLRGPGEGTSEFYSRLVRGAADAPTSPSLPTDGTPVLAFLFRGDIDLPGKSSAYALFRDRVIPSIAASDLIS